MISVNELQTRLDSLNERLQQSSIDYGKSKQSLEQQLANHNALEGAIMFLRQLIDEIKIKESDCQP